jgi:RNA polymerase sigma factor (sigma-70 family)
MMHLRTGKQTADAKLTPERSASDADLVRAARQGDKRAFVEIVARHQAMVCGIALGVLGDFAASEDAAQEAFLTAWRKFHELREPEKLRAWLGQIARNAALGHLRQRRGHEPLDNAPVLTDESPRPDEVAANEEEAALVRASLAKLPEAYRLPLILYYREGQSVRAVAGALDLSEDAVKQRLARGREMLREQMSGLIETVLTRTGPTAIFTMTIAVAIGALAAPAAVAGSVFAVTATGTASASATTSTSLLTAMSTSKVILVAAAVVAVAFIPVGYQFSTNKTSSTGINPAPPVKIEASASSEKIAPGFEHSVLFAEWQQLHDTHGRTAEAMPALYKAISDLKDPFRRRAFRTALIAEWAQLDAAGGMKFFLGKGPDASQRQQFFAEWLALDAPTAVEGLLAAGTGWEGVARESLKEIARRVPARVAEIVARLPRSDDFWDANVREALAIVAEGGLASARTAAEKMTGPNREQALAGVAQAWAKTDLNGAIAWAKSLPNGIDRDEIIRAALMGKAAVNPAEALELAGSVPPGGRHAYFASTTGARVLHEAAATDFDTTVAWLAAHPGRFGREDMTGIAEAVTTRLNADVNGFLQSRVEDGSFATLLPAINSALLNSAGGQRAAVWDWLKTQPDNDATQSLKKQVLTSAAWQDPELALRWVADLPRTFEGDMQVSELARSLFNGGNMLHRFENLLAQSPERLRQPLIDAAFNMLNADNLNDPQNWIGRLPLLPEASRLRGTESIARAWAQQSPEEAIGWASSLETGETRNRVVAIIASSWAAKDSRGAADWINTMTPGLERDRSAESLATTIAERYPQEAWDWALSINDSAGRTRAAGQAAKAMVIRDPATARQWIETGPFPPEIKAQLQDSLASGKNGLPVGH